MAGYVDEKVAKVTLDNKGFSKNADDTISALERMKRAFSKVNGKDATRNIASDMAEMNNTISNSTQKSEGLLSRLKGIFNRSAQGIDMSGAGQSIDRMNTDVASKTATTSSILSRLKGIFQKADNHQGFPNSIKSIDGLNSKVSGFDASPLSNAFSKAASSVQNSLSVMDIAMGNVLGGMMQKAISFGSQFFRGPVDGLGEYNNKLGSIQTIMTNTEWEIPDSSVRMKKVSKSLEDLNDYADKTIYSFADMTKNIGTFTAAGVSLDKAGTAIKGISNLAAASGSNTQQASTAMYQLSQAIAAGRVGLQDWNSVVNAGMGGKLFQDRLTQTAEKLGHARNMTKSFRESLQDGWLTSEVLLETLREFSEDQSMLDAATKVKSFGQLVDTVQEAIGSGWATTWEYFLGGFEEAKNMWTKIGDLVNPFVNDDQGKYYDSVLEMERSLGNYRNAMLKTWKDLGGQQSWFNTIENSFAIVFNSLTNLRKGFRDIIGTYKDSAQALYQVTLKLEEFTSKVRNWQALQDTMVAIGRAFGAVFTGVLSVIGNVAKGMASVAGSANGFIFIIQDLAKGIEKFFTALKGEKVQAGFVKLGQTIGNVLGIVGSLFRIAATIVTSFFKAFAPSGDGSGFLAFMTLLEKVTGAIRKFVEGIEQAIQSSNPFKTVFEFLASGLKGFISIFDKLISKLPKLNGISFDGIINSIKKLFSSSNIKGGDALVNTVKGVFKSLSNSIKEGIGEFKKNLSIFSLSDILKTMLLGFAGFKAFKIFKGGGDDKGGGFLSPILDPIKELVEKGDEIVSKVSGVLDGLKDAISSFTTGIKAGTLLTIATAITMLAVSMKVLSGMSSEEIVRAALGIATASYILTGAMKRLAGMEKIPPSTAISMIGFALAIKIMAKAMRELSTLNENELIKSASGVAAASLILVTSMKLLSKVDKIKVGAFKLIAFVLAIRILVKSMAELAQYDYEDLKRAVTSIGALMLSLSTAMRIMNNVKIKLSAILGLVVFVYAIKQLVNALIDVSMIDYNEMVTGVQGIGFLFAALVASTQALRGAKPSLRSLAALLVYTYSVKELVNALIDVSMIEYEDMITGVKGIGFLFTALVASTQALRGANPSLKSLASLLVFTYSVKELVNALIDVSMIDVTDMAGGVAGLGFLFSALVAATYALQGVRVNLSALASLIAFAYSTSELVKALDSISQINPSRLLPSLLALGAIMGALTIAVIAMTNMSGNIFGAMASALVLLSFVPVLVTIGNVLTQLSKISWQGMVVALGGLVGALTILLVVVTVISSVGPVALVGAATLLILSSSLIALAVPLQILGSMSLGQIGAGLLALAGGLTVLMLAGAAATFVAPGLLVLSAALIAFGVAAIGIGAGIALAGAGMSLFTLAIKELAEVGPTALVGVVTAFDLLLNALSVRAPQMIKSIVDIIMSTLDGLEALIPRFVDFGFKLIIALVQGLTENVPALVSAGVKLITELGRSLIENVDALLTVALEIATAFIDGLGRALISVKDKLIPALKTVFSVIGEILVVSIGESLGPLLAKIAEVFGPVIQVIVGILSQLAPALTPIIEIIGNVLMTLISTLPAILQPIADTIKVLVDGIVATLQILAPVVETIINAIVVIIQTLAPIVQSVVDAIRTAFEVLGQIFTTVGEVIKAVIQGVVDTLNAVANVITATGDSIRYVLEGMDNIFVTVGNNIKTTLEGVSNVITAFSEGVKTALEGVGKIFESIGTAIKTALDGVADIIRSVGDAAKSFGEGFKLFGEGIKLVGDNGAAAATGLAALTVEVAKLGTSSWAGNLQGFTEDIKNLSEACTTLGQSASSLMTITVAFAQMSTSLSTMAASIPTVTTSFDSLSTSLTTISGTITPVSSAFTALVTPIQQLQLSLTEVATSFMMFATQTMMIGTSLQAVTMEFTNIQNAVTILGTSIGTLPVTFDSLGASILNVQTLLSTFATSLTTSATGFQQLGEAAMVGMMAMNTSVIAGMATVQATMLASISALSVAVSVGFTEVSNSVTMSMTLVNATVAQSMQGVMSVIQVSMSGVAAQMAASLSQVMVTVISTMAQLSASIMSSMTSVNATISSTTAQMNATFTQFSSTAQSIVTSLMSTLNSTFQSGMASVVSTVSSGMSSVVSTVSSYSGSANSAGYSVGYQISAGIASGMNANMWSIESAANRIIAKARDAAAAAAEIRSPSRLFARTVGKYIPQGVAKGIDNEMPKSVKQMSKTFSNGFDEVASNAVNQGNVLANTVAESVNSISDMLDVAVDDMNYSPTITPVVDMSNLNKVNMSDYSLDYKGRIASPTPVYGVPQPANTSTVVNTDNSTKEYSINVTVDNGGAPVNPKELAKQVQEHIKSFDNQNRRAKGEEVFW